jgi:TPR repeat protein
MLQNRLAQAFSFARLAVFGILLLAEAFALTIQEGWQLVARTESGDRTALQTLVQAYQGQDPEAATGLGILYLNGIIYPRDLTRTKEYFDWAFSRGSAWAGYWLAVLYANGIGVPKDQEASLRYADASAERGYIGGKLMGLLLRLAYGQMKYEDYVRQMEAETAKAPEDPVSLGMKTRLVLDQVRQGKSPEEQGKLLTEARELARKSAEGGHFIYRNLYAYMLYFGLGGEPDQKRALQLARPFAGFEGNATGLLVWDLYFGNVQPQNRSQACQLAGEYFARPELRTSTLRTIYGLCLMDGGKRVEGFAHLLKAAGQDPLFLPARALARDRAKELSKEELERAKALLKDLP